MNKQNSASSWFNNPSIITNSIIILIIAIMILSQSFAVNNNLSASNIFRDIVNHNINYILVLVYFILLKTNVGKKYFNHLNVFLVVLYLIFTITSCLSVLNAVSLTSILSLAIKLILLVYLVHTMFKETSYWEEFHLSKSLFNELDNEWYFYALSVLSAILFAANMVVVSSYGGAVLTILDCGYVILLARYIYLYGEYINFKNMKKQIDSDSKEVNE